MRFEGIDGNVHYFDTDGEIEDAYEDGDLEYFDYQAAKDKLERHERRGLIGLLNHMWRVDTTKEFLAEYPENFDVKRSIGKASPCMGACARFFGYAFTEKGKYRWLQKYEDATRAIGSQKFNQGDWIGRTGLKMPPMGYDRKEGWEQDDAIKGGIKRSSVKNRLNKKGIETVGSSRKEARKMAKEQDKAWSLGFLVGVKGHVLALNNQGQTVVDTHPRESDRRKFEEYEHLTLFERVKRRTIQKDEAAKRKRSKKRKRRESRKNPPKKRRCPKGSVRNKKTGRCNKRR